MGKVKKSVLSILGLLVLAGAVFVVPTIWLKPWSIDHFYGRVFVRFALRHPMMLSGMRLLEPMGLDFHNDDLDDFSMAFQEKEARFIEDELETLRSYDRASMSDEPEACPTTSSTGSSPTRPRQSLAVPQLPREPAGRHPERPARLHDQYAPPRVEEGGGAVHRAVGQFGRVFDQVLEGLAHREELGIVPPRFVIEHVLAEMRDLIEPGPTGMVLYTHFTDKLAELEDVDESAATSAAGRLREPARAARRFQATRRLIAFFERQQEIATDDDGVWKLPDGEAYYN